MIKRLKGGAQGCAVSYEVQLVCHHLTSEDQSDSTTSGALGCLNEMIPAGRSIFTYIPTAPELPCPIAPLG